VEEPDSQWLYSSNAWLAEFFFLWFVEAMTKHSAEEQSQQVQLTSVLIDETNLMDDHFTASFCFPRGITVMYFNAQTRCITLHRTDDVLSSEASFCV